MEDFTPAAPPEQLEQWEETFAAGLKANSREAPEPWLGGYVHVVEETMPLPEPVRTDPGSVHRLLFMPNGAKGLRECVAGGSPTRRRRLRYDQRFPAEGEPRGLLRSSAWLLCASVAETHSFSSEVRASPARPANACRTFLSRTTG